MKKRNRILVLLISIVISAYTLTGCQVYKNQTFIGHVDKIQKEQNTYLASLPYEEKPVTEINHNKPYFTEEELTAGKELKTFTKFSDLDGQKRVGTAYVLLNQSVMPDDGSKRKELNLVKPTGWVQAKYDWIDNGGWLYNRCHLIAWSLTGENANEKNLMTGTRYFNVEGMLPYEIKTLKYLDEYPDNHVLYRATPVYSGDELLARGLLLEAYSIEDNGKLSFCVYVHNVEPGVTIDYMTGKSQAEQ